MGITAGAQPITIEEYLSNPSYERHEYIDGQALEIDVGSKTHAKIQARLAGFFFLYCRTHGAGYAAAELRCRLTVSGKTRFYLPDVGVVLADESAEERFLERAPDLVVEVRSPDDNLAQLLRKMEDYFANGAKLGWIVLPEERSVLILAPSQPLRSAICGEDLDGGVLLPDLKIPVDELFA